MSLRRDGVVVRGEYAISSILLEHGYNIDTLLLKYKGINWRDKANWKCNNNVHPSRVGMYDGISQHPLETVFIKSSWGVGEPYTSKYSSWIMAQYSGQSTTAGFFDRAAYLKSLSLSRLPN